MTLHELTRENSLIGGFLIDTGLHVNYSPTQCVLALKRLSSPVALLTFEVWFRSCRHVYFSAT